ncbi:MAG: hypothetical protein LBR85_04920 [Oscillospiraceae bacterium]|jgi:hypothetical protein|nr:hypothetical protein [Oscillospiraceae bacterium]
MLSADVSVPGSSLSARVGNLIYTVSNLEKKDVVKVDIRAASGSVLADVKRFAQFGATGIDSAHWDNITFTATPFTIDETVLNTTNEFHTTRIRQQDPATGLWSVYDVHLFASNLGARTDIWVQQIGTGRTYAPASTSL